MQLIWNPTEDLILTVSERKEYYQDVTMLHKVVCWKRGICSECVPGLSIHQLVCWEQGSCSECMTGLSIHQLVCWKQSSCSECVTGPWIDR